MNSKIIPEKNFLLRRGERIGDAKSDTETQVLYKLDDGRLIVHRKFDNPMRSDQLERIEPWMAEHRFQVKIGF